MTRQYADAELRAVIEQLETRLRSRQPDLFDRRGRLRTAALTRRLTERTGGLRVLSGDALREFEEAADRAAKRSASTP